MISPAPIITSVVPEADKYDVEIGTNITVIFDQLMDTLTFNSANFILSAADSSLKGSFIRSDSMLMFVPEPALLDDTDYRVELTTGIKSQSNIRLSDHYVWNFSTGANPAVINQYSAITPGSVLLKQNYPNPFNPSTTIEFQIPNSQFTSLKVYNIAGKEVSTLVSKELNSGNHTYIFDGKNLASGLYYYQLLAGEYREVKKMILLK